MALIPNNMQVTKRVQIDKAQATTIGVVATAVFVTVFSLISCKALLAQRAYQQRVIAKQEQARDQLKANVDAVTQLVTSYKAFVDAPDNVIGGNSTGSGDKDGNNAKIVLDALPSKYDFPAIVTSLEKILSDKSFKIAGITGSDDELAQSKNQTSNNPLPVAIPFAVSVNGSYQSIQDLVGVFEKSIRPIKVQKISFSGGVSSMQLSINANTYYQPEKIMDVKTVQVK